MSIEGITLTEPLINDLVKLVHEHEAKAAEYETDASTTKDPNNAISFKSRAKSYRFAAKKLKNLLIWHGYAFQGERATKHLI